MEVIYLLLLLLAISANFLLILALALRNERSLPLTCFIFFLLLIVVWGTPQFILNLFHITNQYSTHLSRISALGYTFIPVSFLLFTISFSKKASMLRKYTFLTLVIIPAFAFLYLSWTTNLVVNHDFRNLNISEWGSNAPPGLFFPVFLSWFEVLMFMSLMVLVSVYRTSMDFMRRRQSLWLISASLIPLSIGTITDGIFPIIGKEIMPLAVPLTTIMSALITYAILKYELFEVSSTNVISSLGDGLISIDNSGKILLVNSAAEKMLGMKRRELLGNDIYRKIKLINENDKELEINKRPSVLAIRNKKKITSSSFYVKTKIRKFHASFTANPMISGKKVTGAIINFRDITHEKEIEKSKDEFISVASHELKTPVTALKLYTQVLEKQLKQEGKTKYASSLSRINYQADRLIALVGDLLNVSKIQTGKSVYDKKPVRVDSLVNDSLVSVKPSLNGRKIIKDVQVKEIILGDKEKLSQVITNLIVNADKYSPKDKEIIVKSKSTKKEVIISVKDFGIGIPKTKSRKIFKRFYQVGGGIGPSSLGIGLYISKEIIKNHGGKIWVKSAKGKGATFAFSIPIHKS